MADLSISRVRLPLIAALTGFFANLAQVALFRFFMGQFYGTEIHLGLFLSIWLAGIAMGGYVSGKSSPRLSTLLRLMFILPFLSIALLQWAADILPSPDGGFLPFGPVAIFMAITVIPASFTIGMFIPCLVRLTQKSIGVYYSIEAVGAFASGILFSVILGGTADAVLCLLVLPLLAISAMIIQGMHKFMAPLLAIIISPAICFFGPQISGNIENAYWKKFHGTLELKQTVETPYQKLQLGSYYELNSIFSNGMFAESWPLAESAESRIHTFVSALQNTDEVLVIGAPTPDAVAEFLKYPGLQLSIVESDTHLVKLLNYPAEQLSRVRIITEDPRFFLNHSAAKFDGLMINLISPVTLAGNRLFTIESFTAAKQRLKPAGVFSLQVSGSENYMGSIKEKIVITTWRALNSVFPVCVALPGSNITFFASQNPGIIPGNAKDFASRFSGRNISTATFYPMSFHNMLMPFRVTELQNWLKKDTGSGLNTDAHPDSFVQQLELWNIYSGTSFNDYLSKLQKLTISQLSAIMAFLTLLFLSVLLFLNNHRVSRVLIAGGVAISGATGLLCEIILILIYQNQFGAAYQMTAFFFGVYMLGLAGGSMAFGRIFQRQAAIKRLKQVKIVQILFTLFCVSFVNLPQLHSAAIIGVMVFFIAFLDGIEFPVGDSILRDIGRQAHDSAGLLLFADNAGALLAGVLSGLWLLPSFGMRISFFILAAALIANLIGLLLFSRRLREA